VNTHSASVADLGQRLSRFPPIGVIGRRSLGRVSHAVAGPASGAPARRVRVLPRSAAQQRRPAAVARCSDARIRRQTAAWDELEVSAARLHNSAIAVVQGSPDAPIRRTQRAPPRAHLVVPRDQASRLTGGPPPKPRAKARVPDTRAAARSLLHRDVGRVQRQVLVLRRHMLHLLPVAAELEPRPLQPRPRRLLLMRRCRVRV
jgi:hypothetical protein